jgi:hypothetical protein
MGPRAHLGAVQRRKTICPCLVSNLDTLLGYTFLNLITLPAFAILFYISEWNTWKKTSSNSIIKRNCIESCTSIT